MEVRYISPEEAVAYLKISAASFIWNFDPEVDKSVEVPVLGAFDEGKLIAGVEIFDFKTNIFTHMIYCRFNIKPCLQCQSIAYDFTKCNNAIKTLKK